MDIDAMVRQIADLKTRVAALEARPGYSKTHEDRIRALEARDPSPKAAPATEAELAEQRRLDDERAAEEARRAAERAQAGHGAGPVDFG